MAEISRFDIKLAARLTNALSKLFDEVIEQVSEDELLKQTNIRVCDRGVAYIVEAKTMQAKLVLRPFFSLSQELPPLDNLDYVLIDGYSDKPFTSKKPLKSRYSLGYLMKILKVLDLTDSGVDIWLKCNYPATLENEHFKFVLAPRIEED